MNLHAQSVAERLTGGPPRGLGCANTLVQEALRSPDVLRELVAAVQDKRPLVTVRAANALNKVQQQRPEMLWPYASALVRAAAACADLRTRWNLTAVIGALPLRGRNKALAVELLFESMQSSSGFLRTFALTGLVRFAREDAALRRRVQPLVLSALEDSSGAVRARARQLRKLL